MRQNKEYRELLAQPAERLGEGVRGLVLVDPAGKESFDWEAGAHLSVTLPSGMIHRYFVRGNSNDRLHFRIGVPQKPPGHPIVDGEQAGGSGQEATAGVIGSTADGARPAEAVVPCAQQETGAGAQTQASGREALTSRETEILEHVARALSNRQIATQLSISEGTVKRHLRNIFTKLDARSRMDAVNKALPQSRPRAS
ncbi:regulatory protein, luxR family [Streptomyces sp. 2323.1]|uniref:LuxR C-terminal-related transcriptional regulator n=1 Tax=Streptomyces sp. 2323.1 TaxID=1938841 RepID=UPI000BB8D2B2|nr:LuxR C-terminal-related transcriptional regulator [Streptomyces sp. 2323.1]SOE10546.1 regulatory protein, luxR family [Streptomyces sp. 2323.1]